MTDKETLLDYRLREAEETLLDARTLLEKNGSSRTVINRAYYAMFYGVLALFIKEGVKGGHHALCQCSRSQDPSLAPARKPGKGKGDAFIFW